ncbi:ribose ABC transporter substrate-binding protein RbsB [Amphibacillus xylanus]|uniref:Putative ribose ABC transporter ribose-binding protein n=1 Tax=Amphibacillus xylanus (strain ATCC 51415 / DSM 6626 / JCM 7361 / LMG 17667 / NBRC 15112 / Ep01) TaxID=698758 RepID=K0IZW6_AMPXN|nr:ribose ABC transporter substrate-binding protein RbsB [Amphibacillus xylanus]BAM48084.1 putative ribose ABC transporter ribose-binding protein [Amphibacillus xylanus NBRC 15112]
MKKWLLALMMVGALIFTVACSLDSPTDDGAKDEGTDTKDSSEEIVVGFSISTLNNPFFVTLADGAEDKANELGIEIRTIDAQDDVSKQISDVEDLIQQKVDVILINPTDSSSVGTAVESANAAGIPVITVDRESESGEVAVHVASDNVAGGELAGELMVELLGEGSTVAILEGVPGSSSARERGEGFNNIASEKLEVATSQTANFNRSEGLTVMENMLRSNPEIQGVFAHNDEMALGALEAVEAANKDIVIIGFDATDDAVEAVENGRLAGTIAQQPVLIGVEAIEAAFKLAKGEEVESFIPVELQVIR